MQQLKLSDSAYLHTFPLLLKQTSTSRNNAEKRSDILNTNILKSKQQKKNLKRKKQIENHNNYNPIKDASFHGLLSCFQNLSGVANHNTSLLCFIHTE